MRQNLHLLVAHLPTDPVQPMSAKRQLTLHVDADVAAALDAESKRRGLTLSRAANNAMRQALLDETGEGLAASIRARLDRLDLRDRTRAADLAEIKRAQLLFVRIWLEYAGALDEIDPDADAEAPFKHFLELLDQSSN